jgi:hypothetical protein
VDHQRAFLVVAQARAADVHRAAEIPTPAAHAHADAHRTAFDDVLAGGLVGDAQVRGRGFGVAAALQLAGNGTTDVLVEHQQRRVGAVDTRGR